MGDFPAGILVGLVLAASAWWLYGFRAAPVPPWLLWRLRRPRLLGPGEAPTTGHYHHLAGSMDLIGKDLRDTEKRLRDSIPPAGPSPEWLAGVLADHENRLAKLERQQEGS